VLLNRPLAEAEDGGDVTVGTAVGDGDQDLGLPTGQAAAAEGHGQQLIVAGEVGVESPTQHAELDRAPPDPDQEGVGSLDQLLRREVVTAPTLDAHLQQLLFAGRQGEDHPVFGRAGAPDARGAEAGFAEPDGLAAEQALKDTTQPLTEAIEIELSDKLVDHLKEGAVDARVR
jgi:hypothetical protein